LTIEPRTPWDFIKIPQTKSVYGDVYEPVVYGDFTPNASVSGSETNCTSRALWPMPTVGVVQADIRAVVHSGTIASGRGHFYDKSLDKYIPVLDNAATGYQDSAVTHDTAVDAVPVDTLLQRVVESDRFKERSNNDSTNFAKIIDTAYTTYVIVDAITAAPTDTEIFGVSMILPDGEVESAITISFDWSIEVDVLTLYAGDQATLQIKDNVGNTLQLWSFPADGSQGFTDSGQEETFTIAAGSSAFNISAVAGIDSGHAGNQITATVKIRDLRAEFNCKLDSAGDAEAIKKRLNDIDYFYCGADGPDLTYTDAPSVTGQLPHHIYRDLLYRFTGVDFEDDDIANWDEDLNVETARAGWYCRLWENEPVMLSEVLHRLEKEGQFIFQIYGSTARVIPLLESYSSADISLTGDDIDNIKIGHTPFKDMVSQRVYKYDRDPATDEYQSSYATGNAINGNRSNWGFETQENVADIELRYLVAEVDELATVQNNLYGEPRLTIECDVVNPSKSNVQIGDRLAFSSMPREPLGGTFTGTYWMVYKTHRTPGGVKITAQEVG